MPSGQKVYISSTPGTELYVRTLLVIQLHHTSSVSGYCTSDRHFSFSYSLTAQIQTSYSDSQQLQLGSTQNLRPTALA